MAKIDIEGKPANVSVRRLNSVGIAYTDQVDADALRAQVAAKITRAIIDGHESGEATVGGKRYRWTRHH